MEMIKKLTVDDVCVSLHAEDEDLAPESNLSPGEVKEFAQAVEDMRCVDPYWGWCTAVVKVMWGQFEAKQYMGGCSYRSADAFKEDSGYYDDMVKEALAEVNSDIQAVLIDLRKKGCI